MMRKFHTQFTEKNLTGNAGLINLGRFAEKLGLPKILANHLTIERAPNADYQVSEVVMMLAFGVLVGVKHMSHMAILRTDEVLRALFKWDKFPVSTSFGRIFKLFTQNHCKNYPMLNRLPGIKCGTRNGLEKSPLIWTHLFEGCMAPRKERPKGTTQGKKASEVTILFCALLQKIESVSIIGSAQGVPIPPMAVLNS